MEKRKAFILAFLITILIALNISFLKSSTNTREITTIKRVLDGDTIEIESGEKVRLLNINAPEKNSINNELSTSFLNKYLNKSIELEIEGYDKYGRTLARIYAPDYLNLELVKQGLASKYLVQDSELKDFSKAEETAINLQKGIWNKNPLFNCLTSKIMPEEEKLILSNKCDKLNMSNFILKDESRRQYIFKDIQLEDKLILHTGQGKDNETDIFWNSKTNIWNNDGDSVYLFDPEGKIIHYNSYGY